jgi:circadian clock protein KaiC
MGKGRTLFKDEILEKSPTGINGFDEITGGGLPKGRPTLVAGSAGAGKTLMGMEFIVHGARDYGEPGVFVAFEESVKDLVTNTQSMFDVRGLVEKNKIAIDHVYIEKGEIEETGEFDLDGLFVRLAYSIDQVKAKRVVLDTIEVLFAGLPNEAILRAELRRLFRWLKERELTTVVTGERGRESLTRHGLEEYVADCVVLLDHRVHEQISTRRLRVVKYRGSSHGANEYPFLIGEKGISVLPITSVGLGYDVSREHISSGIPRLDAMLEGKGFYRGSSVLLSGTAGTGKTSLASTFAKATAERGERCLYFAYEESQAQIIRNMQSIGIHLQPFVDKGLLKFVAGRPSAFGLEMHLTMMHKAVEEFKPSVVVVDLITNFIQAGSESEVRSMLTRMIDFFKARQITSLFNSLTRGGHEIEQSEVGMSSLMDVWIIVRDIESSGERNRGIMVLKARGTANSNQIREFRITGEGIKIEDVYVGPSGVLTGAARAAQEAAEKAAESERRQEYERKRRELDRKRAVAESQIAAIRAQLEAEEEEIRKVDQQERSREKTVLEFRDRMWRLRKADQGDRPEGTEE